MRNFLWILALLSALMCSTLASTSVEAQEYVKTFCPNGGSLGCWEVDKSSIQERGTTFAIGKNVARLECLAMWF